jgi:tmRNA-binding protein
MSKEVRSSYILLFKADNLLVFNSATDLVLTVMPLTIFWTLQMDMKIKLGLAGLLGLSVL